MTRFHECVDEGWGQYFDQGKILDQRHTGLQDLVIFEHPLFGRVLLLDGVVQTTELDEHLYHEMLVHMPMIAHGAARRVLIIGGGDGGTAREVLKHALNQAVMVEIYGGVVDY